jgi:small subunit ribosomal protein S3
MGHKVNPLGFRLGVIRDWQAKWYADKHYADFLQEDMKLRKGLQQKYAEAAISIIEIERQANKVAISIHTSRPGIVIGRGGQRVDETRKFLEKLVDKKIQLNIHEIQRPELDAILVAKQIAEQMERRIAFRRAMKQTMMRTMQAGAKGMRVSCAGRLGGAEIARRLTMHEGQVPLHTLRADIDYGFIEANTVMGKIGVKVWIYKGDILPELKKEEAEETVEAVAVAEAAPVAVAVEEKPAPVAPTAPAAAEEAPKPAIRRRRTVAPKADVLVESAAEEKPAEATEEAPKPAPRRRRTTAPKAETAAATEEKPAAAAEETPKPATRRRRTTAPKDETPAEPKE